MSSKEVVSQFDISVYNSIRSAVREFQIQSINKMSSPPPVSSPAHSSLSALTHESSRFLDIAPQIHDGISKLVSTQIQVETLDIDPKYNSTYVGDICTKTVIPTGRFDAVFCTEVLEHVSNPFEAIKEINRILKPGGYLFASSPFGFRIHGPLPDNWRISEHGWRELLKSFQDLEISPLNDPDRFLMPLHYCVSARKALE
jgi:SAM-dependent methyltransferase